MSYIKKIKLPSSTTPYDIYDSSALHSGDKISLLTNDSNFATETYVDNKTAGLTGAMHFKGTVSSLPTDFSTYDSGDVVLCGNKEYVCDKTGTTPKWVELGDEGSYVLKTQEINGHALSGDITLTASDVGALSSDTTIPTKTSQLTNDSGYITSAPVTSVNSKTGAVTLSASDVGALSSSTTALKNPNALTFTGAVTGSYDGSATKSVAIPTITLNGSATTTPSFYAVTTVGTEGQVLKSSGSGAPVWGDASSGGTKVVVSDTEPSDLSTGDLWLKVVS